MAETFAAFRELVRYFKAFHPFFDLLFGWGGARQATFAGGQR